MPYEDADPAGVGSRGAIEAAVESVQASAQGAAGGAPRLENQPAQRRRQGEGHQGREQYRYRQRQCELPVQLTRDSAQKSHWDEDCGEHQGDAHHRTGHLFHRLLRGRQRVEPQMHVMLDGLHHHDGVVHNDANCEHQSKQRQRVDGEPQRNEDRETSDQRNRDGQQGNQRGAEAPEEEKDNQNYQSQRFEQRLRHFFDGTGDEARAVIGDAVVQSRRKAGFGSLQSGPHTLDDVQRIRSRRLVDDDERGWRSVQPAIAGVVARRQFGARHVPQPQQRSVRQRPDHDVVVFLGGVQTALDVYRVFEVRARGRGRLAQGSSRRLYVLILNGRLNIGGRQPQFGEFVRASPDAHGIVALADDGRASHTRHAAQLVHYIDGGVVTQVNLVVAIARRVDAHHRHHVGRLLLDGHPVSRHFRRQIALGGLYAVLHVHRSQVQAGSDLKSAGQAVAAVVGALRRHVEHFVGAIHLLFQRNGDRLFHHGRIGAAIDGFHGHRGRRDLGVLRDWERDHRQRSGNEDNERENDRQDRAMNEEAGHYGFTCPGRLEPVGRPRVARAAPS